MRKISLVIVLLVFAGIVRGQNGFSAEVNFGLPVGSSSDFYSFALQGNIYYLGEASSTLNLGITTGALVLFGGSSDSWCEGCPYNDDESELYIPLAIASRLNFSSRLAFGLDVGYAIFIHVFDDGGGLYLRPVLTYNLNDKLALIMSYVNISEPGLNPSTFNIGLNIGF